MRQYFAALVIATVGFWGFAPLQSTNPVYHITGNFSYDIEGEIDTRPDTWGTTGALETVLTFDTPPDGKRIRIRRIIGDVIARADVRHGPVEFGHVGILGGICKSNQGGSIRADWAADGCFMYIQGDIRNDETTERDFNIPFHENDPDAILPEDNKLVFKFASYLNTIPGNPPVHGEITFSSIEFDYVSTGE